MPPGISRAATPTACAPAECGWLISAARRSRGGDFRTRVRPDTPGPPDSRGRLSPHKPQSSLRSEEVPGFLEFVVEAGLGIGAAAEEEAGGSEEGFEWDDVPGVLWNDVGGEEIDFAGEVRDGAASGAAVGVEVIEAVFELRGTLDLHAPERRRRIRRAPARARVEAANGAEGGTFKRGLRLSVGVKDGTGRVTAAARRELAGIDDGVVAFAVAEGPGDSEAEAGGFEGEGEFGKLSATLGVEFTLAGRVGARRWSSAASRWIRHIWK